MRRLRNWFEKRVRAGKDDNWRLFPVVDTPESTYDLRDSIAYLDKIREEMKENPRLVDEAKKFEARRRERARQAGTSFGR